jgi:hypothetical protein
MKAIREVIRGLILLYALVVFDVVGVVLIAYHLAH